MKILIVDRYYPTFLEAFLKKYPNNTHWNYRKHLQVLMQQSFGTSDFYSYNLNKLNIQSEDIIANDEVLQSKWAQENKFKCSKPGIISKIQSLPIVYKWIGRPKWLQEILIKQIEVFKPDILYIQDLTVLDPPYLVKAKNRCKLIVGQIASPLPSDKYVRCFDLILTSFPHFVEKIQKKGIACEYFKIGFEKRLPSIVGEHKRIYDVVFIGSFTPYHMNSTKIIEQAAKNVPIQVWGNGIHYLAPNSLLRKNYHGPSWGLDMYKILSMAKIVLNRHISVAGDYANNMRLYESTGMGAMLLTDEKKNLGDLFSLGKEIETYKDSDDLVRKIRFYLKHEKERISIAQMGQQRTLREHTYKNRMKELLKILQKYI